jgi:hypothetical protein
MKKQIVSLGKDRFEVLTGKEEFLGLGKIWVGETLVRSGRLPIFPHTQSYQGWELIGLSLRGIRSKKNELRLQLDAKFHRLAIRQMRDHSLDPIHDLEDWSGTRVQRGGSMDLVLRLAKDRFYGTAFDGFSYHYEYRSEEVPLYWMMDRASWELDGNIQGATVFSQSAGSAPAVTFRPETVWSTEGILDFLTESGKENPVMTHNYPRWASHGSFDFQYKGDKTLLGVFERVGLIRSVVCRSAGQRELKHFDKHIFDEALEFGTVPKKILLNVEKKTEVGQKNVWTWVHEDVEERARAEFGLKQEPVIPTIGQNFWENFTVESYFKDLIPAAAAIGCRKVFVDNLKKSAYTDKTPFPGKFHWNMCCGHEFGIAPELGGDDGVKSLVSRARKLGVTIKSWTNNDQALSSPLNSAERDLNGQFVIMDDARQKYGGAYGAVMSVFDFNNPKARSYFIDSHTKIKKKTGLNWWLFDSFYNLAFMPVSYHECRPRTMWRALLETFKTLQDAGVHFTIESFGPFGRPQHGHPSSYNFENLFICYRVGVGNDYSTIPTGLPLKDLSPRDASTIYYVLAHMALTDIPLYQDGERVDKVWGAAHRQALADYHAVLPWMKRRVLQEDGLGVVWEDDSAKKQAFFNFQTRELHLPGKVKDVTTGRRLPKSNSYSLEAFHTYLAELDQA